jgi:hypothetical protein
MRQLLLLALLALLVLAVVWVIQRVRESRSPALAARAGTAITGGQVHSATDRESDAVMVLGPEPGPGRLRLAATQLVFTAASQRVAVLERADITGVSTSVELPDRRLAKPALVVVAAGEAWYLVVPDADRWCRDLT